MIILDLTNCKSRHITWPLDMPKKIRLIKGQHQHEYDFHPMVRNTKWYKELYKEAIKEHPWHSRILPLGIDSKNLTSDVRIIDD